MVWHFGDCSTTGGDSGNPALLCDNNIGTGFSCSANVACTAANGALNLFPTTTNNPSRLYAAKAALQDVLNSASGSIDFGLSRYALSSASDGFACPNATSCCAPPTDATSRGRCVPQALNDYPDVPNSVNCLGTLKSQCNLTAISGCGTSLDCDDSAKGTANCSTTEGGQVLVQPAANSSALLTPWIDFVEDFCSDGTGKPRNPELRAAGATPLAGTIRTARKQWYQQVYNVSEPTLPGGASNPSYNPSSPIYDPQINCRSYVNVVMTDGVESCENSSVLFSDPTTAVQELTAVNPLNPVKTYVIGVAFVKNESCNPSPADGTVCPKSPSAPGGGCSVVNGQSVCSCNADSDCGTSCEPNAALAGAKVHYVCGSDHVCHHPGLAALNAMAAAGGTGSARFASNQVDIEAAFADIVASTVKVEKCNNADDDCDNACDEPFPDVAVTNPACSNRHAANGCNNGALAGTHCYATGAYVCSADQLSETCNAPTCATNTALCPTTETCNNADDDCNGVVDDCVPFVAGSCCNKCPACNPTGKPQPETCNGCDDDCDGVVDNHLTDTGFACGSSVGLCVPGTTYCCQEASPTTTSCTQSQATPQASNPDKLVCLGGRGPSAEVCDGADNNCDGVIDGLSQTCYTGPAGTAGVGVCKAGTQQCTGTACGTAPNSCCPTPQPANGTPCPGPATYGTCSGQVTPSAELCNGLDDNCNGVIDENVTDPWVGQPCCPTGNLADCQNTGGGTRCQTGAYQCVNGARACVGAVQKTAETCNGVDDNCNGIIDDVAGIGSACTSSSVNTTGICTAAWACAATPGPGPNGLTCTQQQGPKTEICNGLDDNCNGVVDDNPTGVGVACGQNCPGGLVANCIGACKPGSTACVGGALVCQGSVGPTNETCNGVDDNCNGVVDDVAGAGTPCTSASVNTVGICTADWQCAATPGPGPNGLTCTQVQGPQPEVCNGLDDNCNGKVDDNPTDVGGACGQNCPGGLVANCVGACKPGVSQCVNGTKICAGSTGPSPELCNNIDDNCNGIIDDMLTDGWEGTSCCPTGNLADCMNSGGGTRCQVGAYQCVNGGRVCAGGVAKSPETCNSVDDDCNGLVDDVPGIGAACSGAGVITIVPCTAKYTCTGTFNPSGPNGLTCTQAVGPKPELCNGIDDDCSGVIDDHLMDPRVGVRGGAPCTALVPLPGTSFPSSGAAPPCDPGTTACKNGMVVCQGEVQPTADMCGSIATDCTGNPNANGNCPTGFKCVQGSCNPTCVGGEFDTCPGGSRCDGVNGVCVPDQCKMLNCQAMHFNCELNSTTGKYECVDPCSRITCPSGQVCKSESGGCIYNDCRGLGCPQANQECVGSGSTFMCVTDLCKNADGSPVVCPSGEFCDPATGMCKNPCQCAPDQKCVNGECVADPCKGLSCPRGEVCAIVAGVGTCVENQCQQGCNPGTVCCSGMCLADPCATFVCPGDSKCQADDSCQPTCAAGPKDEIAAAGGGGATGSCSVAGASAESARGLWLLFAVVIASLLARKKRMLGLVTVAAVGLLASGCNTTNFCLNCNTADGYAIDAATGVLPDLSPAADLALPDLTTPPDLTPVTDACVPTNNGIEICDNIDNDCNGVVDDVAASKLANDPNNCGKCFNVCDYNTLHEEGLCVNNACTAGPCLAGWVKLDPATPGCNYQCTPTVPPTEVCDGKDNDCNGKIDEPFGYPNYATDPNNCGGCGIVCNLPGAVATCVADLTSGKGICAVDHCINDGKDTYKVTSFTPGVLNTKGCDYHCPFPSTTTTTGSQDCNTVTCSFPAEVCNGLDDDCNFKVDDALTDVGGSCGQACPGGNLMSCVGQCKAGTTACVAGVRVCQGSTGPSPEICNGLDDDCDGKTDDNLTDTWVGQACCPTGNLADCYNTTTGGVTGTRCAPGSYACVSGGRQCQGGVPKTAEVCNGIDDDCNGIVDDVPGLGGACSGAGVNTTGICTAHYVCNGTFNPNGPNGLTCAQNQGPKPEVCNGLDDNCDGTVDNAPLMDTGGACGQNCPGGLLANCRGACTAGIVTCQAGALVCSGSKGPTPEVCNGADDDCNGIVDDVTGIGSACTGANVNTAGICTASWQCTGTNNPGGLNGLTCTQQQGPKTEVCNGLDDNCNGVVDGPTELTDTGAACGQNCPGGLAANCVGACKAGSVQCSGGVLVCQGSTAPSAEVCNGVDDDCNGVIDDGFGYPNYNSDPKNCGACGTVCGLANATNGCHSDTNIDATGKGVCYVVACNSSATSGFSYVPSTACGTTPPRDGPSGVGCNYACPVWPTTPEVCDGKDNDCNGAVDELKSSCYTNGLVAPAGLCATQGVCAGQTIPELCTGAGGWKCNYSAVPNVSVDAGGNLTATEPFCDGLDNNCNGVVDKDGFPTLGNACTAGLGVCQNAGTIVCTTRTTSGCSATPSPGRATNELCNGKDDDCNGLVDESTDYTDPTSGITYKGWRDPTVAVPSPSGAGNFYIYAYEATRPDATATSAGGSSARACSNVAVKPWQDVTLAQAQAACAAVRDSKGQPLRLCTAPEWQKACEGPSGAASSKWSMSKNPQAYVANICNDLNAGLGASWATGSNGSASAGLSEFCYADWAAAGQIHDLSGNLAEWTSTAVVNGANTYYKIRGGAYDSPSGGTTCEFDFDLAQSSFANADVGFRCCADNPSCGNVASDPNNCGACGTVCTAAQVCSNGACAASCAAGLTNCNRACVDTTSDFANCGGCGTVCPNGQTCTASKCGCPSGTTLCNGACVNTQTDPGNCGGCNVVCASGQVCSSGSCIATCGSGLTACGASCVNELTDANNCGGCGVKCGTGISCISGACCTGTVCSGACVNTLSDNNNCGGCGTVCAGGATCQNGKCCGVGLTNCGGVCVNLQSDANNCNACGNVCPVGNACTNGSCCGSGLLACGNQCVNPLNDNNNCGKCFNACPTGNTCSNGGCCPTGQTNCGGVCVDLTTNSNNCGACGSSCGSGQCKSSVCTCGTYQSFCNGACIFTNNDFNNCGGCGKVCAAGQVCSNGLCTSTCSQGSACNGSCYDTGDDPFKCGASCTNCSGNATNNSCLNGSCVVGAIPFVPNPSGICTANGGLGPVIQLSTTLPPRSTGGGTTCSGDIASTSFGFGVCACASFSGGGNSTIDAWDSTIAPYNVGPNSTFKGKLGGSMGVNTSTTIGSNLSITGDLDGFGDMNASFAVEEQLHIAGTDSGSKGSNSVGGLAEIKLPVVGYAVGTNNGGLTSFPDVNMYVAPNPPNPNTTCAGYTIGGTCKIENPFNVQEPCKRCDKAEQVPIAGYIANYKVNNDNALIGLTTTVRNQIATAATGVLTLPCGYYYLDAINVSGNFTIVATGNTALFIGGNVTSGSGTSLTIDETPGARLDVFVLGAVSLVGAPNLGDMLYPANSRVYIGCSSQTTAGSCSVNSDCCSGSCVGGACSAATAAFDLHNPSIFAGDFYLPNGPLTTQGNTNMWGAIFVHDYVQASGNFNLHYDRASALSDSVCPPPTGNGCTTCLDCSNQACNIPSGQTQGTCGGCNSDADCCAPLRCVPPNSTHSGTCQFTSF